ncbi:MAG: hypothetical protein E7402_05880 [Ruminococcaceae bacterium]|nr:hypothetical protein [Oscillospiraceae bacterium]
MKRFILLTLCMVLMASLVACAKPATTDVNPQEESQTETEQVATEAEKADETATADTKTNAATKKPQEPVKTKEPAKAPETDAKAEVATKETAPDVSWTLDTFYHLTDCKELEGKPTTRIDWEMVQAIGLRSCPVCNPPKYENYIEDSE